ncbi:MAG TPA: tetratricopeptide repeat protein [Burkholderiales bacterium]|nr:tetratricopeptide repeat protein [Burkholderiales bacterium]
MSQIPSEFPAELAARAAPPASVAAGSAVDLGVQPDAHRRADLVASLNELALNLAASEQGAQAEQVWQVALRLAPQIAELHANLAEAKQRRGDFDGAIVHYREACARRPDWADVWNNLGICLRACGNTAEAIEAFHRALAIQPQHARAWYNLGNGCNDQGRKRTAQAAFAQACAIDPSNAEAHYGLATTLDEPERAEALLAQALQLRSDFAEAWVELACARLRMCQWTQLEPLCERVERFVAEQPDASVAPFLFIQISGNAGLQQQCARNWSRRVPALLPRFTAEREATDRLRVGYLSGDLRNHAVGYLIVDLFDAHDPSKIDLHVYSTGPDDGSEIRRRAEAGGDRFRDVRAMPDTQLAQALAEDRLDVLVDLSGYTEHGRSHVLSARVAPIQLSYLGFPGTMSAPYIDGLIGDAFLMPPHLRQFYDEPLVLLPGCYQVSRHWPAPAKRPDRGSLGLPEQAFVFCCFNNSYKIRPHVFDVWMRLLHQVPASVLWLAAFNARAQQNLRREAAARGIDPARIIFAPVVSYADHSKRLPAADLFLDTYPYSAGATANQTLACGVPLLTLVGDCYVSRMAGSLLHALGLPQLITTTLAEYEMRALELARDAEQLAECKRALRDGGRRRRVFHPSVAARALEQIYADLTRAKRAVVGAVR